MAWMIPIPTVRNMSLLYPTMSLLCPRCRGANCCELSWPRSRTNLTHDTTRPKDIKSISDISEDCLLLDTGSRTSSSCPLLNHQEPTTFWWRCCPQFNLYAVPWLVSARQACRSCTKHCKQGGYGLPNHLLNVTVVLELILSLAATWPHFWQGPRISLVTVFLCTFHYCCHMLQHATEVMHVEWTRKSFEYFNSTSWETALSFDSSHPESVEHWLFVYFAFPHSFK